MANFDWKEFLEIAEELIERRGDVGAERTAISRAYYAAYHEAAAYYVGRGERLSLTGDDHGLVWDWFLRSGANRASHQIGRNGLRLRQARRRADYDSSPIPDLSREASRIVTLARALQQDLAGLR